MRRLGREEGAQVDERPKDDVLAFARLTVHPFRAVKTAPAGRTPGAITRPAGRTRWAGSYCACIALTRADLCGRL
jgi:hypothetical protein